MDIVASQWVRTIDEPPQRVLNVAASQRVRGIEKGARLSKRLEIAKILQSPQPTRKKIFSQLIPRSNLLTRSNNTKVDLSNPTRADKNITDPYVAPKKMEQLADQTRRISPYQGQM